MKLGSCVELDIDDRLDTNGDLQIDIEPERSWTCYLSREEQIELRDHLSKLLESSK